MAETLNGWQPIETARKPGPILIHTRDGCILIVTWENERWDDGEGRPWRDEPTHWMPLPNPPDDCVRMK